MGGACSTYGRRERCVQGSGGETWGDPDIDGRIMLGWIFKKWDVGVRTGLGWLRKGIGGGRL
jgi:hypothetical protein